MTERASKALRDWIPVALAVLAAAGAALAWTAKAQIQAELQPITARVIVLETRRESDGQRLERIESKLDRLLEQRSSP